MADWLIRNLDREQRRLYHQAELWSLARQLEDVPGGATPPFPTPHVIFVDPRRVNIDDLINAKPGRIVRVERAADVEFPHGIGWAPITLCERIELL
jgi:hypothetical protein